MLRKQSDGCAVVTVRFEHRWFSVYTQTLWTAKCAVNYWCTSWFIFHFWGNSYEHENWIVVFGMHVQCEPWTHTARYEITFDYRSSGASFNIVNLCYTVHRARCTLHTNLLIFVCQVEMSFGTFYYWCIFRPNGFYKRVFVSYARARSLAWEIIFDFDVLNTNKICSAAVIRLSSRYAIDDGALHKWI